jgi:hypothetical protein
MSKQVFTFPVNFRAPVTVSQGVTGTFYGDGSNLVGASLPGQQNINTTVQTNSANWNSGGLQTTLNYISTNNVIISSANILGNLNVSGTLSALSAVITTNTFISNVTSVPSLSVGGNLTVVGNISATGTVFSSGAPVVVSTSTFETPTTGISAISNIVALSQANYNALTVKLPTTLYVIV